MSLPRARCARSGFGDIAGTTFEDEIACAAWYGITEGTAGGDYEPFEGVTRWQMALFVLRFARYADPHVDVELPAAATDQGFTDIGEHSAEARDAINMLAKIDVINGTTATTYAGDHPPRPDGFVRQPPAGVAHGRGVQRE